MRESDYPGLCWGVKDFALADVLVFDTVVRERERESSVFHLKNSVSQHLCMLCHGT